MATRKKPQADASGTFFGEYLGQDQPLTRKTAKDLVEGAGLLLSLAPWELIEETDVMFVGGPLAEPLSMCSVIGAMGESFAFFAHVGGASFYEFREMQERRLLPLEFFARQYSVRVEFVRAAELTKPDRALLAGMDYAPGSLRPMFRTIRPHYHAWYPTEIEGRLLMTSIAGFLSLFKGDSLPDYWEHSGVYPSVEPDGISLVRPPESTLEVDPAQFDDERVRRLLARNHRRGGTLEVDCFHAPGRIGGAKERKMWLRLAVALDAKTRIAYPPEAVEPHVTDGDAAAEALCLALENGARVPDSIVVSSPILELALKPLADRLEAQLVRHPETPAIADFRDTLSQRMFGGKLS